MPRPKRWMRREKWTKRAKAKKTKTKTSTPTKRKYHKTLASKRAPPPKTITPLRTRSSHLNLPKLVRFEPWNNPSRLA